MTAKQLECRVVLRYLSDGRARMGMYDPVSGRYEPLGTHGPAQADVDRAVRGLRDRIAREGHLVTFSEMEEK